ncbi:hypothetical protein [Undibacterium fentianense]|uniref:Uncharacterized protein n=1 Tax=Undibacterium fentianense TaxID=2828728 RepID=A0A941E4C4_9BURK|nr:hypothetical protein [Undibacterium fentianense]MBR7801291.1 hypothetical protein [Undibacterium fentianense]
MRILKNIGLLIFIVLANVLFWRLGGVPILTLGICLAIAGSGNRILWLSVLTICLALSFAIYSFGVSSFALGNNIFIGILGFGLLPLLPALLIWTAHNLRIRREFINKKA